jgi:DNA polymerase-3 subunit delta'
VDDIRRQIVSDVPILPYQGQYKVYIMPEAEKMNPAAQNALLKTLEEPPSYAVILLLTVNAESFLETIRSRCVLLTLKPVRETQVEEYLMQHVQIPDYQARLCASFAQGSIGAALRLATSQQFQQLREEGVSLVRRIRDLSVTELIIYIKELAERKNKSKESYPDFVKDYLDILTVWFRDVLYFKATRDADRLIFRDQLQLIRSRSQVSSYEGIETILQALDKARQRLDASVSFELTMELLFLTIKEN